MTNEADRKRATTIVEAYLAGLSEDWHQAKMEADERVLRDDIASQLTAIRKECADMLRRLTDERQLKIWVDELYELAERMERGE